MRSAKPAWPADKIERRAIEKLIPNARNARRYSAGQIAQVAAAIKEFGWTMPVLIDEGAGIIAGHGRVLAAQTLGIRQVPVIIARGWSETQKRAYALADNKLTENSEWDDEFLLAELQALKATGADIGLTGFTDKELEERLAAAVRNAPANGGDGDPDEAPEPSEDARPR